MEDILNLLIDYSKQRKIVDEKFMYRVIEIMIDIKNINNFVYKFKLSTCAKKEAAIYLSEDKTIIVYDNFIRYLLLKSKKYISLFDMNEIIFYYNLVITQVILHELEHATQFKIMKDEDNMEAFILRMSYNVDRENAVGLYEILPHERLAEINSFQNIYKIIEPIKKELPNVYDYIHIGKIERQLRGYHYYVSKSLEIPLINFFVKSGNYEQLYMFEWFDRNRERCLKLAIDNYTFKVRLKYGLPIEQDEYSSMTKQILLSKKYLFNVNR